MKRTHRYASRAIQLTLLTGLFIGLFMINGIRSAGAEVALIDHESPPEYPYFEAVSMVQPHPQYEPADVIRIQVEALSKNDIPYKNAGVELAFRFASPSNKESTGPLRRFLRIVSNPFYRPLLDHQTAEYGTPHVAGDKAIQLVVLTSSSGERRSYLFLLSKQQEGHYEACWMTDNVMLLLGLEYV